VGRGQLFNSPSEVYTAIPQPRSVSYRFGIHNPLHSNFYNMWILQFAMEDLAKFTNSIAQFEGKSPSDPDLLSKYFYTYSADPRSNRYNKADLLSLAMEGFERSAVKLAQTIFFFFKNTFNVLIWQ